jgi:hypothetical protein
MGKVKDYFITDDGEWMDSALMTEDYPEAVEWEFNRRKPYLHLHPSEFGPDVLQKLREVATINLDDEDIPF